jgi:hypothetical protein
MNNLQAVSETRTKTFRRAAWAGLLVLAVSAFAMVAIPVKLIMPFSAQSQDGLSLSYTLRHWSPSFTLITALVAIALVLWLWRGARWWRRIVSVLVLIPIFAATWFARQNHFEWMFNPLDNPTYANAAEVGFVESSDMVMAVENNNEAVAYPIRLMAYHHLVQDTVGGTPLVATY